MTECRAARAATDAVIRQPALASAPHAWALGDRAVWDAAPYWDEGEVIEASDAYVRFRWSDGMETLSRRDTMPAQIRYRDPTPDVDPSQA